MSHLKYYVECNCGKTFKIRKSQAQNMGLYDLGYANCPYCNTLYNTTYVKKDNKMTIKEVE